jgi:ATP-dependent DNA helicase PIF1
MNLLNPEFGALSDEKKQVIQAIENGENVFVTGGAGTGKSYLLNLIKRHYSQFGLVVTASTGIAAVNIGGSTIYSWAGIGLGNLPVEQIVNNLFSAKFSKIRSRIIRAKILAIDEISMISCEVFEILDEVFRKIRQNDEPMGGLQILLFGDFLQLPPISRNGSARFCFDSKSWKDLNLNVFELQEVFRQTDKKFVKVLNNLRFAEIDEEDFELLNSRLNAKDNNLAIKPTILTSHNFKADEINQSELKKIPKEEKSYEAKYQGDSKKIELLQKNCIAYQNLKIKIGSQVMMTKNTYQKDGVINGSLGIVKGFSAKKFYPIVEFANGVEIAITPEEWLIERFDEERKTVIVEASMTQIPLILAWAITIHKSQGLTLDKISCDLSATFDFGQVYVALSRARNLSGVFIKSIDFSRIKANESAIKFYRNLV